MTEKPVPELARRCLKCQEMKPLSDYHREKERGHKTTCRVCRNSMNRKYYSENIDSRRTYFRARNTTPERRAAWVRDDRRRRERSPDKNRARELVRAAVRAGKLERLSCEFCGETRGVHAHHEDYSKPLDVWWLCRVHHLERHAALKEGL